MTTPEEKPGYLQDVMALKETEPAPEGFDLDREFGKGTKKRVAKVLKSRIQIDLEGAQSDDTSKESQEDYMHGAAVLASRYFILFGERVLPKDTETRLLASLKDSIQSYRSRPTDIRWYETAMATEEALIGQHSLDAKEIDGIKKFFRGDIEGMLKDDYEVSAAHRAAQYRIIFEKSFWTTAQNEQMIAALKESMRSMLSGPTQIESMVDAAVAEDAAAIRILCAHDLKFIPGKGIEIIDISPQFKQTPIPPMPEERKF